jgi:uncharacterized protein
MSASLNPRISATDPNREIGTVCGVLPSRVHVNLGDAASRTGTSLYGHPLGTGQVGEFVLIASEDNVLVGRVTIVRLVERERLAISPALGEHRPVDPIGEIDLLATLDRLTDRVTPGISAHPRLGSRVYSPAPDLMASLVSQPGIKLPGSQRVELSMGTVSSIADAVVAVAPERLFGRHCAILGATGGGKSFTIAKLIEECAKFKSKTILFDATGEFYKLGDLATHFSLGTPLHGETEVHLPFSALEEQDLYGLFQPSGKVQGPKLRDAIYSLRISHILETTIDVALIPLRNALQNCNSMVGGQIIKSGIRRKPYEDAMNALRNVIESPDATFDIRRLSAQIVHECVWGSGRQPQQDCYGGPDGNDGYCAPLLSRINSVVSGPELRVIFQPKGDNLLTKIGAFLKSDERVLRISLASVPYVFNAREIVANALGRRLLSIARTGALRAKPVVIFLDEAHNFLNRRIGEDDSAIHLDAFDQIAKEGRKHWLTICLATQRPRDLPEGVLSQMGTMIVHRLINGRDRDVVERACGDIDRAAVAFLPTLAPGQAAIVGVDFPFPLTITLDKPNRPPDSSGPDFQSCWK